MSIAEMFSVQRFLIAAFVVFQNAIFCKSMNDFFFFTFVRACLEVWHHQCTDRRANLSTTTRQRI